MHIMRSKGDLMAKKKETIQDILDRINEDIENIREKVEILESEVDSDFDDEEDEE
jgi:gas vesicle protein